ncbi:MAG: molybdenum cofactor guanylyltransferase MobA [Herbaspirillum sp.]
MSGRPVPVPGEAGRPPIAALPGRQAGITGAVLAGGMGRRMGGLDKGLQNYRGQPLALNALNRLRPQVERCLVSANRHLPRYAKFGAPVVSDGVAGFAGPLAGLLATMAQADSDWLLTVPCDVPAFPHDLATRLMHAIEVGGASLAVPATADPSQPGAWRPQPVFCLVQTRLRPSLEAWLASGERRVMGWARQQNVLVVPFTQPEDARAFANINTLDELAALETLD